MQFVEKSIEFSTPRRVYCSRPACRRFLGAERKGPHHIFTCPTPACGTKTCSRCKLEVYAHVPHACRPEVPRRPSLQGQKTPMISQVLPLSRPAAIMTKTAAPVPLAAKSVVPASIPTKAPTSQTTFSSARPTPPPPSKKPSIPPKSKSPPPPPPPLKKPDVHRQSTPLVRTTDRPRAPPPVPPLAASKPRPPPPQRPTPVPAPTSSTPLASRHERAGATWARAPNVQLLPSSPPPPPPSQSSRHHRGRVNSPPPPPPPAPLPRTHGSTIHWDVHAQEHRARPKHGTLSQIDTLKAKEARNTADSHLLTALEEQVDNMIRTVGYYPCRHEWRVDVSREVCDTCGRKTSVLFVSFLLFCWATV